MARLDKLDDSRLAARVGAGDEAAFSELYDRHHKPLLFVLPAHARERPGRRGRAPADVHPGAPGTGGGRCRTRSGPGCTRSPATDARRCWRRGATRPCRSRTLEPSFDGFADDVARRADLRELVADMARAPEDQRGALGAVRARRHVAGRVATAIGVPAGKVKALVYQARTELMAERDARRHVLRRSARNFRSRAAARCGGDR